MNRSEKRRQEKYARKAAPNASMPAQPSGLPLEFLREGIEHHRAGRPDQAEACYRQALAIAPDHPDANHLVGLIAHQRGDHQTAIALMSQALRFGPDNTAIHNNLGLALQASGRREEAAASYRRALVLQPAYVEAHCNLGNVLMDCNRAEQAAACYRRALTLNPNFAGAWYNLGNALRMLQQYDDAIAAFDKAIALRPAYAKAHNNLADVLKQVGRFDDAMEHFRQACAMEPDAPSYYSSLIFMRDFDMSFDLAGQQAERKRWNDRFAAPLAARIKRHDNDRNPDRRLRVGYISADFRTHSAAQGFAPLILDHDHEHFEVFCYAVNIRTDETTEMLRRAATCWRDASAMSDDELTVAILADGIDILVDLSGHSDGHRLLVFARKPAPIQVTGIGHLAPGLDAIDYRYTTHSFTCPEEESLFPERPLYLDTLFGYMAPADAPDVAPPPCGDGDPITFGSMNRLYKISPAAKALWAEILRDVPGARLLIKFTGLESAAPRRQMEQSFESHGVSPDRLILLGGSSRRVHLQTYNRIDMSLDTFPHGGGITTMESLWMGVPVLGLYEASKLCHRVISTFTLPAGMDEWIADSRADYLRRAIDWANRRDDLAALRRALRDRVRHAYGGFTRQVEDGYRIMWRRWCAGEPPRAIDLSRQKRNGADGAPLPHHAVTGSR